MDKNEQIAHEQQRKKLWCDMAVMVASASNCIEINTPAKWADKILNEFDSRFKKIEKTESND